MGCGWQECGRASLFPQRARRYGARTPLVGSRFFLQPSDKQIRLAGGGLSKSESPEIFGRMPRRRWSTIARA
jgi:hypothetical protein